jgi:hypothetical protein
MPGPIVAAVAWGCLIPILIERFSAMAAFSIR